MKRATVNAIIGVSVLLTGCAQQADWWNNHQWSLSGNGEKNNTQHRKQNNARLASNTQSGQPLSDIHVADQTEIELAGDVARLRTHYIAALNDLREYYDAAGDQRKLDWCQKEITQMVRIKPRPYVQDAAIAEFDLRAARSISEADKLYDRAISWMQHGGYGQAAQTMPQVASAKSRAVQTGATPPIESPQLIEAYDLFVQLIDRFPQSDKIDDAAFCCGEIIKECFPNRTRDAIRWYDRCVRWDSQTPHPAQLQIAVLYDFRLNDPVAALANYHAAVNRKGAGPDEVAVASARIESLVASTHSPIRQTDLSNGRATNVSTPADDTMQDATMQPESPSTQPIREAVPVRKMDPMTPVNEGKAVSVDRTDDTLAARS